MRNNNGIFCWSYFCLRSEDVAKPSSILSGVAVRFNNVTRLRACPGHTPCESGMSQTHHYTTKINGLEPNSFQIRENMILWLYNGSYFHGFGCSALPLLVEHEIIHSNLRTSLACDR
jgi:hypothetical protein